MPRRQGSINKPKSDAELIADLKARGYSISKGDKPPAPAAPADDPPEYPPAAKDSLTIKKPAGSVAMNTCGLCGGRFPGKPANCPICNVQFSGWRED
jgi:hypothetical protein